VRSGQAQNPSAGLLLQQQEWKHQEPGLGARHQELFLRKWQTSWTWEIVSFDEAKLKKIEMQEKNTLLTKEITE
jgi:hypothetical protein